MSSSAIGKFAVLAFVITTLSATASPLFRPAAGSLGDDPPPAAARQAKVLEDWPAPEAVFVFSGQQHGYLEPCGCSPEFQKGGLARRFGFIKTLQQRKWPVILADLGGLLEDPARQPLPDKYMDGQEHAKIKLETALDALHQMNYEVINLAPEDLAARDGFLGLMGLIANLNDPPLPRVLSGNFTFDKFFTQAGYIFPHITRKVGRVRLAIIGMLGENYRDRVADQDLGEWLAPEKVLRELLNEVKRDSDLRALMLYGTVEEAQQLAAKFPDLDVIIHASDSEEPNDRAEWVSVLRVKPAKVGLLKGRDGVNVPRVRELEQKTMATVVVADNGTVSVISSNVGAADEAAEFLRVLTRDRVGREGNIMLVTIGVKGKNAAAIGIFEGSPRLRFDLVPLDDRFDEDQGIRALLDDTYIQKLKDKNLVKDYPKKASDPTNPDHGFVGSQRCGECHKEVYKFWQTTRHAHALETLVEGYKDPKSGKQIAPLKHHNPDCVSCHSTGFFYTTGYDGTDATRHLGGNGCENCHGAGSEHAKTMSGQALDKETFDLAKKMMQPPPQTEKHNVCERCHDFENSPKFSFDPYWEKVEHGAAHLDDREELKKIRDKLLQAE